MRQSRSIAVSLIVMLAYAALADAWVHSPDGKRIDRVAQPLPRIGINLTTRQGENMRECDAGMNAMCGWYRVIPAAQPTNTVLLARGWTITNLTAVEVLTVTNKTEWCLAHGIEAP